MDEREVNTDSRVLYFVGCAANFVDPEIGRATVRVLERNGIEPRFPDQECCGISELFYGNVKAFRKRKVRPLGLPPDKS